MRQTPINGLSIKTILCLRELTLRYFFFRVDYVKVSYMHPLSKIRLANFSDHRISKNWKPWSLPHIHKLESSVKLPQRLTSNYPFHLGDNRCYQLHYLVYKTETLETGGFWSMSRWFGNLPLKLNNSIKLTSVQIIILGEIGPSLWWARTAFRSGYHQI